MSFFNEYQKVVEQMNHYYQCQIPCLFVINFKKTHGLCIRHDELNPNEIDFSIYENSVSQKTDYQAHLQAFPKPYVSYLDQFNKLQTNIQQGETYLCNLTQATPIHLNLSLKEIFTASKAVYKLWIKDQFVVFSPEPFVIIENDCISTFPMKGTADGTQPDSFENLKKDLKENAEHNTIVDLLRNDLSIVAQNVEIKRLKYIENIKTHKGELWQMSTEISGKIRPEFRNNLGHLFDSILPAGSICGAPKLKTLEIIDKIEDYSRDFYTGVFGYYDGKKVNSAVMIRFIEKSGPGLVYKSGGGITALSNPLSEYQEFLNKIYVPVF
ncbi:MAG: aminodeoxychorismate synthase component I [Saprospiraceae bacterium]|nr:aminodeoxychorismate synthase component I [Saprospiraceae bacterium]